MNTTDNKKVEIQKSLRSVYAEDSREAFQKKKKKKNMFVLYLNIYEALLRSVLGIAPNSGDTERSQGCPQGARSLAGERVAAL